LQDCDRRDVGGVMIHLAAVWGKQPIDGALIAFGPWILLEEELIEYRLCSSDEMERLRVVLFYSHP
jgi:hypothetical protein